MNKKILSLTTTLLLVLLFASCGMRGSNNAEQQTDIYEDEIYFDEEEICETATFDEGVVIGGVRWATRNVDRPGTFAPTPESVGRLFQWNRRAALDETSASRRRNARSESWEQHNDPCPTGWRVPTLEELQLLQNAGSEWVTKNGRNGRLFGTAPNQIFLPATEWGRYQNHNEGIDYEGYIWGFYWSSSRSEHRYREPYPYRAWYLSFSRMLHRPEIPLMYSFFGSEGGRFSVRCVAK